MQLASQALKRNRAIILEACAANGDALLHVAPKLESDREVAYARTEGGSFPIARDLCLSMCPIFVVVVSQGITPGSSHASMNLHLLKWHFKSAGLLN